MRAFVFGLPKAELHVHLEGTLEPAMYVKFARRNHIASAYKTPDEVRKRLTEARDVPGFIVIYEELIHAVQTERDFHDLALAYFRNARAQDVVHAEVYFDPELHIERGVPLATVFAGLVRARREARRFGLDAHYIMSFLRDRDAANAESVLEASRPWRAELIGVGLDNPEVPDFPRKFAAVFERAKSQG